MTGHEGYMYVPDGTMAKYVPGTKYPVFHDVFYDKKWNWDIFSVPFDDWLATLNSNQREGLSLALKNWPEGAQGERIFQELINDLFGDGLPREVDPVDFARAVAVDFEDSSIAWKAISGNQNLRVVPSNIKNVDEYNTQNPLRSGEAESAFNSLVGTEQPAFLNGLSRAIEPPLGISNARRGTASEIAEAVSLVADHRSSSSWAGNWGFLEGEVAPTVEITNPDGSTKFWRSVSMADAENESRIFTAIDALGGNGREWLRITDSEYRMLNQFASNFGAVAGNVYPEISGTLKIVSENPYCDSCQGVIQQFNEMFPNINLILIDGIR